MAKGAATQTELGAEHRAMRSEYTPRDFIRDWLEETSYSAEDALAFGRFVERCNCSEESCKGWQMGRSDSMDDYWWKYLK